MLDGSEGVYEQLDLFMENFSTEKANFVIIGPMGFVKELGEVSQENALDEAKKELEKEARIRLCMRTKDFGAVQIDIK